MTRRAHRPHPPEDSGLVDLNKEAAGPRGPEVPELRKKEKEEKAPGVFWRTASPGAGGSLARAASGGWSSPLGFGRLAASLGSRLGAASFIGRLLLSRAGGWFLLGSILIVGGALGVGMGLRVRTPRQIIRAVADSLSGSVAAKAPRPGGSLDYLASANRGAFRAGDAAAPAEETTAEAEAESAAPALPAALPAPVEAPLTAEGAGEAPGAPHPPALAKFGDLQGRGPSSLGGGGAGGGAGAAAAAGRELVAVPKGESHGSLASLPKNRARSASSNLRTLRGRADRAMGQLKLARNQSYAGANAGRETAARQYATNAFEQGKTQGGELAGGIGAMNGAPDVVVPPGSGAPDITRTSPPPVGPTRDSTPYQGQLDQAENMGKAAGMLRIMGMLMMAAGAALCYYGYKLLSAPDPTSATKQMGWAMVAAGVAMIGAGVMALAMAQGLAAAAKQIGDDIKNRSEQKEQGQIATDSAKAKADGREYTPPDLSKKTAPNAEVHRAVEEESNAGYTVGQ